MTQKINKILLEVFPKHQRWKMELLQNWDIIIGDLKDKVKIEKIENNVLVLGVCHPSWAQEIFFFSDMLKERINRLIKVEKINKIRFKIVDWRKNNKSTDSHYKKCKSQSPSIKKDIFLTNAHEKVLNKIQSEGLRNILRKYYIRCFQ